MTDKKKELNKEENVVIAPKDQGFVGSYYYGRGRRKESSARVRLYKGAGKVVINGKEGLDFFSGYAVSVDKIFSPLKLTGVNGQFDVSAKVEGGGKIGQADAIKLGVSRALLELNPEFRQTLRKAGFLTRDPREKERKKPGLKRARKAPQFSKR